MDFTLESYDGLLDSLKQYRLITVADFFEGRAEEPLVILRHDVEKTPKQALRMAILENKKGIASTYYFRFGPDGFPKEEIIEVQEDDWRNIELTDVSTGETFKITDFKEN